MQNKFKIKTMRNNLRADFYSFISIIHFLRKNLVYYIGNIYDIKMHMLIKLKKI